jgi:hypothetical protein
MRKRILFGSSLVFSVLFFSSCNKDNADSKVNEDILGNYKLVSLTAKTEVTQTMSDGSSTAKTVSKSNYTTINNQGTLKIEPAQMISTDMSYSVNTIGTADIYEDGVYIDTYDVPFQAVVPSSSATAGYKWITKDSIYFESGSMFYAGSSTPLATSADGARVRLEGDKLYISGNKIQNTQSNQSGYIVNQEAKVQVLVTFQKQ